MKRIFPLLLVIVTLFTAVVPFCVHAAEEEQPWADVTFTTVDVSSIPSSWISIDGDYYAINMLGMILDYGGTKTEIKGFEYNSKWHEFGWASSLGYGTIRGTYNADDGTYTFDTPVTITFPTDVFATVATEQWVLDNGSVRYYICDGTDCYWADDNYDGVCDTCGMTLFNFRYTDLYAYAEFIRDEWRSSHGGYDYWVITSSGGEGYTIMVSQVPFTYNYEYGELYNEGAFWTVVYKQSDGTFYADSWQGNPNTQPLPDGYAVDSSHDIEGFFPIPLHLSILQVTQRGMLETMERISGTMTTLTLCGVGCLALLVVLSLFGTRLFPYLRK